MASVAFAEIGVSVGTEESVESLAKMETEASEASAASSVVRETAASGKGKRAIGLEATSLPARLVGNSSEANEAVLAMRVN